MMNVGRKSVQELAAEIAVGVDLAPSDRRRLAEEIVAMTAGVVNRFARDIEALDDELGKGVSS